ncbi:phage/plasmid replication domain-containing protein [Heyndrickxia ginsengihumi]|uniref:phage/plasmid replication domain-containing protein n=1 Tax=Heyndrickxia ginsengihumi TaxID=363870 RepID=UPI0004717DD7|nr:phage/plasmid replication protein [Heyndrickxia ginsengihumi]
MIHTFEMFMPVNDHDIQHFFSIYGVNLSKYQYIRAAVKQLNKELKLSFPAYAITLIWCEANVDWYLQLKVDAIKILGRGEIVDEDYDLIESNIRKFLVQHFGHSDYFDFHTLTRIDYRLDVKVPNQKDRELLFHLLEKYTYKYRYKEKIKWGKDEDGNPIKYDTSQYHKNKSIELVIYSKEDERVAKGETIQSYDENVVRYELRLKNNHLNSMKRTDKGISRPKLLKTYFSSKLQKEYMEKHVLPIVHKGDYFKITEVDKIIENSQFSKRKKGSLRNFLVMISKGCIDTPKKHMSKPTYRQYLHDLGSIGINPVLIPKNRTDYPNFMKNPFQI